ncbi:MAG: GH116 family glycosyl hydrolase, partial [Calditrichia bacterium]
PALGSGLVAGLAASGSSGRPGFGWYFGGDAFINLLSLNRYGVFTTVRDALAFTQKWQREDGKMAHELSQSADVFVDWWNDYHYGFIHGDTTPWYIVAMADYCRASGDTPFVKKSWNSLKKAYEWCLSTDANNDGLMDNKEAGLGASEYGEFTGIETDIYLAAVWTKAAESMSFLAGIAGDVKLADQAEKQFSKAREAFNEKFWILEKGYYAYAFDGTGKQVQELAPWQGVGLMFNLGTPERTQEALQQISAPDLTTDWGLRLLSNQSKFYNPVGYNYGASWPHVTAYANTALFKHHFSLQGYSTLMSTARLTFADQLGAIPEVMSGDFNIWLQESVPHQGFSSGGAVMPLLWGLLGLDGDALKKIIEFAPQVPADWPEFSVENFKVGQAAFDFRYLRSDDNLNIEISADNSAGFHARIMPSLGIGTKITSVTLNKNEMKFSQKSLGQSTFPIIQFPLSTEKQLVEINFEPTVELLPPTVETQTGDKNHGLKIISVSRNGGELQVELAGLAAKSYWLDVVHPEKIDQLQGGNLQENRIYFKMPDGKRGEFSRHQLVITTR